MKGISEVAEFALRLAESAGGEYAEAYFENSEASFYSVEQGKLNGSGHVESTGLRIRILKKGSMLTVSTNNLSKSNLERLIKFRPFKGASISLSDEKKVRVKSILKPKKEAEPQEVLESVLDIEKGIADKKYIKYRSIYAGIGKANSLMLNSEGSRIELCSPSITSFINFIINKDGESRQRMMQFGGIGGIELFDASEILSNVEEEAKNIYNVIDKGISISKNESSNIKSVVISPEIAGIAVHESVGHANEADRVFGREAAQAGLSYIGEKELGSNVGSKEVTIVDDPGIKYAYGFFAYDDEGVRGKKKTIVKKGMQNELLTNREYAASIGKKSTGSSRSDDYSNEPLIRMSNTYLEKGDASLDELASEARNGVYIKSYTEWNIDDTRSFSRYQGNEAYIIRNGRIKEPVKNYALERKTLDFWRALKMRGKDLKIFPGICGKGEPMQGMPVSMGGPSALLVFE